FEGALNKELVKKIKFDGIANDVIEHLETPDYFNVMKTAIDHSDAIIVGSSDLSSNFEEYLKNLEKPVLKFHNKEEFSQAYLDFYESKVLD
ncbi:MAG: glycogen synthase, partial [Flavobacteriaceae bacterium]|nr:glycogen synthase [Flavobacteriaceae bacterium]